jgi:hypothetical protein
MIKRKKYIVDCDIASVRIFTADVAFHFPNGIGDGSWPVYIYREAFPADDKRKYDFLDMFTVRTEAYLSQYDCNYDAIHVFKRGRYGVHRNTKTGAIHIEPWGEDSV